MIRILLADDHKIVREGTRQLLERAADLRVVAEAGNGEEAVQLAAQLQPDVVVMDVHMPRCNGLDATHQIKAQFPQMAVLILSAYEDNHYVFPLLEAGANGYLLKTTGGDELIAAIRSVQRGETILDSHIAGKVVQRATHPTSGDTDTHALLTPREREVLQAVAGGMSNKEVADMLFISLYTVQVHLRNIFNKLDASSRTEAVTLALSQGLISLRKSP